METKLVVIGLIENDQHQFLISLRNDPKIKEAHLKWDFVGGQIEFGESPEEALKREVKEETGLNVSVGEMAPMCFSKVWEHDDHKLHVMVLCYSCKVIDGAMRMGDWKIQELRWIEKDEFPNYDFLPSINLFLKKISF